MLKVQMRNDLWDVVGFANPNPDLLARTLAGPHIMNTPEGVMVESGLWMILSFKAESFQNTGTISLFSSLCRLSLSLFPNPPPCMCVCA